MKFRLQTFCSIVMVAILSTSCQPATSKDTDHTSSNLGSPTMMPLSTIPLLTPEQSSTSIPTSTSVSKFDFSCWPIKPLAKGNAISGEMLYANYPYKSDQPASGFFAWDLNTFQNIPIKFASQTLKFDSPIHSSPDGKLVALISGNNLMIISHDETRSFPLSAENLNMRTYLPDGRILLDLVNNMPYYQQGKGLTNIYYTFDLLTGKTTKYSVFLPNFVLGGNFWAAQYSPDMKYILYKSSPDEANVLFTLYDLEKNKVVWIGPSRDSNLISISVPAWRPDSSEITTIYKDETGHFNYYSISLDGKVTRMNNFNGAELEGTTMSNVWSSRDVVGFANWSPNGRYLASRGYSKGADSNLYIWDNQHEILNKPCIPNEEKRITRSYNVMWSFDERYAFVLLTFLMTATPVEVLPGQYAADYVTKGYILNLADKIIYEVPDIDNNNVFVQQKNEYGLFLGWVNWKLP